EPSAAEDPDAAAQLCDLAEDGRREEDRLPPPLRLEHRLAEDHLHQRVEPARGLVEEEQVRARRERRDQLNLLAVSLPQGAHLLPRVGPYPPAGALAIRNLAPAPPPGHDTQQPL